MISSGQGLIRPSSGACTRAAGVQGLQGWYRTVMLPFAASQLHGQTVQSKSIALTAAVYIPTP